MFLFGSSLKMKSAIPGSFFLGVFLSTLIPEWLTKSFAQFAFFGITLSLSSLIIALLIPFSWIPIYWICESKKRPVKFYYFLPSLPSGFCILWTALILTAKQTAAPVLKWFPSYVSWSWSIPPLEVAVLVSAGIALLVVLYLWYKSYSEIEEFPWHTFWLLALQVVICFVTKFLCALSLIPPF